MSEAFELSDQASGRALGISPHLRLPSRKPRAQTGTAGPPAQLVHRAPPLRSRRRLPAALANGVDRCLEPDPAGRHTVEELRAALEPVAEARG